MIKNDAEIADLAMRKSTSVVITASEIYDQISKQITFKIYIRIQKSL